MPLSDYHCEVCDHRDEEFHGINSDPLVQCPKCGASQSYRRVPGVRRARDAEFHTPIQMYSIGCNSMEEIRDMQRAGVQISDDPKDEMFGIPIARTRQEKLKALEVAGFVETR